MRIALLAGVSLGLISSTSAQQVVLDQPWNPKGYHDSDAIQRNQGWNAGSNPDFEVNVLAEQLHLSSISSEETFVTLKNPKDPSRKVRVKKTNWCDPTVNVYTGYLDVGYGTRHLFFYFFESRNQPDQDDVVMWMNGGPGSSSTIGMLMELGPCNIDMTNSSPNGTVWNPYGWNTNANIFFLEQPAGVGFSYASYGEHVSTTEEAAQDVASFLSLWFEAFPQFEGRKLHLSGESYGGRYLPVIASEVVTRNKEARKSEGKTLNLQSVLIGNGNTDISELFPGKYTIQCGTAALDTPWQDISTCVRMKTALPRCQKMLIGSCVDTFDEMNCRAAVQFCQSEIEQPYLAKGINPYDISKPCLGDGCYLEEDNITALLNDPKLRRQLGVEITGNFSIGNNSVSHDFDTNLDKWRVHNNEYIVGILERGVRVLIYAGTYDWQCNWVMNYKMVQKLDWSRGKEFRELEMREWSVDGNVAGKTKTAGKLTFATILGAGHMVPHDKPLESLTMFQRWMKDESL